MVEPTHDPDFTITEHDLLEAIEADSVVWRLDIFEDHIIDSGLVQQHEDVRVLYTSRNTPETVVERFAVQLGYPTVRLLREYIDGTAYIALDAEAEEEYDAGS